MKPLLSLMSLIHAGQQMFFTVKHFSKRLHLLKKPVTNLHKSICVINTNTADLGFKHEKI